MLNFKFFIATLFIAGALADVPLKQFNKVEYELTEDDAKNFLKILTTFGLTDDETVQYKKIKEKTIFTLGTPEDEGGEYTVTWKNGDDIALRDTFKLNDQRNQHFSKIQFTDTSKVEDNRLINTTDTGDKTLTVTFEFSANQVLETTEFGDVKAKRVYTQKSAEGGDAAKPAEGPAAT